MLKIEKRVYEEMIDHAKKVFPIEACGYLVGNETMITALFRMKNVDNSPEHFSFDPREQFDILKKTRNAGLKIWGVYHSHPYTAARMSDEDVRLAYDERLLYAIVSLMAEEPVMRIFRVDNKVPAEVEYVVIEGGE